MGSAEDDMPADIKALIDHEMSYGGYDTAVDVLRAALHYWAEHRDTIRALDEALDEVDAGLCKPWEVVDREFRKRNSLPHFRQSS